MASKKSARKSAAPKSAAPKSVAPKKSEAQRRMEAVEAAKKLYDWEPRAIINLEEPRYLINLAELAQLLARGCTTADICKYLTQLATWLVWFQADYTKLRRAVCNVERRAWGGPGDQSLRFCSNGTGSEPADPTPPPIWH